MVADGFRRQANGIKSRVLESVSLTFSTTVLSCEQLSHLKIFLTVAVEHALPRNLVQALVTSAALSLCLPTDASKMHRHYQTKPLWNEILTLCTAPLDSQFRQELCKTWLITVQKSILFLRRKFRVFCTKNQLCLGVFLIKKIISIGVEHQTAYAS